MCNGSNCDRKYAAFWNINRKTRQFEKMNLFSDNFIVSEFSPDP